MAHKYQFDISLFSLIFSKLFWNNKLFHHDNDDLVSQFNAPRFYLL